MEKGNDNKNNNETDSDEFLSEENITKNDKIKINKEDFNIYPEEFEDFDEKENQEKMSKESQNINLQNNSSIIKEESSNFELLKLDSKDGNLNINSILDKSANFLKKDINNLSENIKGKLENQKSNINYTEDSSISFNLINDKQSEEDSSVHINISIDNLNNSKKNPFHFKDPNLGTYSESDISLSKSNISINKKEEDDININMNDKLILKFEAAYPELSFSRNEYKKIFALLTKNNYFDLTIFEIMNIIQREISIKITENKYNNKYYEFKNDAFNLPFELLNIIDPVYINTEHLKIIKFYKTICIDDKNKFYETKELTEDFFYDKKNEKKEKRRKVIKFLDGGYNYIPVYCPDKENCDKKECIYCHNKNEMNYHPLLYKTKFDDDNEYCDSNIALCPTAKNFDEDFRIIYNYKEQNIINLMNDLNMECKDNNKRIKSFYKKIKKFDINTFKIFKCKKEKCEKDTHLCYYYHNISEKRRPPYLYRYINQKCQDKTYEKGKIICKNGDFCNKCHTSNEFNYHKLHFKKYVLCCRDIKNGECIFIDTCYGYHDEKNEKTIKKKIIDKVNNELEKLKKEKNVDDFKCNKCERIPKSITFYYLKCKHILCNKCYNKISDNICPLCEESFKPGEEVKIDFKESTKNIDKLISDQYK